MHEPGTLAAWLDKTELTSAEVAKQLETTPVTLWRIKTGKQWPGRELASRIAEMSGGTVTLAGLSSIHP